MFGAVIANFITENTPKITTISKSILFIILLFLLYIIFKEMLVLYNRVVIYIKAYRTRNEIPEDKQLQILDYFYSKVVNEIILGVSLVNRIEHLQKNDRKKDLWFIYAMQAKHSFAKAYELLNMIFFMNTNRQKNICTDLIGHEALLWTIEIPMQYLDKIHSLYDNIDTKNIINSYIEIKKLI